LDTRKTIRKTINDRRSRLPITDREVASRRACHHILNAELYQQSQHLGLYFSYNGEIDPHIVFKTALQDGKSCYLPVLDPVEHKKLVFVHYESGDSLIPNQFDIPEPILSATNIYPSAQLDLVIMPLVAFDDNGHRLGMGAGYYDRTFAFLIDDHRQKPQLIGLAYEFQHHESIEPKAWDVPMHGVSTEKQLYLTRPTP